MTRVGRALAAFGASVVILPTAAFGAAFWSVSNPRRVDLPLPEGALALASPEGAALLARSPARADADGLIRAFQTQEKGSWCGIASAVTVLNAKGGSLTQDGFFTPEVSTVRSWWRATFGGMPLDGLAAMLDAHGADAEAHHAGSSDVETFRRVLAENLGRSGDWVIVNYDRSTVGESGGGHHSPLAAYDPERDLALLLDVASYKYPPHWVPVDRLFAAMSTPDSETGRSRGWLVVR